MSVADHIERMQDERSELEERIAKGQTFLDGPGRTTLDRNQVHLLNIQLDTMRLYLRVLNQRIEYDHAKREFFGDADASES